MIKNMTINDMLKAEKIKKPLYKRLWFIVLELFFIAFAIIFILAINSEPPVPKTTEEIISEIVKDANPFSELLTFSETDVEYKLEYLAAENTITNANIDVSTVHITKIFEEFYKIENIDKSKRLNIVGKGRYTQVDNFGNEKEVDINLFNIILNNDIYNQINWDTDSIEYKIDISKIALSYWRNPNIK